MALSNLLRNSMFYTPYVLTCLGCTAMFYIMCFLTYSSMIMKLPGGASLKIMLQLGCIIIGIFSAAIMLYANSFVMKRRRSEIGLYNILGMEKKHISRMMFWETIYLASVSIVGGLAFGILLSKLILLLLLKLVQFSVPMGFSISIIGIRYAIILQVSIFMLIFVMNLFRIQTTRPIELLRSESEGEREPKTKWFMTLLGIVSLTAGYVIAVRVESPIDALALFFLAVLLVMLGTYCLFTAGSIALLKGLRRNSKFYYKTQHFTAVSGMLYRMKQNAVGLANICILSTMVLVTVSTTLCLYMGLEEVLNLFYPTDISVSTPLEKNDIAGTDAIDHIVTEAVSQQGRKIIDAQIYTGLSLYPAVSNNNYLSKSGNSVQMCIITAEEYGRLSGDKISLHSDQVIVYSTGNQIPDSFFLGQDMYHVIKRLDSAPTTMTFNRVTDSHYLVVSNYTVLEHIMTVSQTQYVNDDSQIRHFIYLNIDGSIEEKISCASSVQTALDSALSKGIITAESYVFDRSVNSKQFYSLYGGFLFLGIFLGFLFLMTTVLIIYYKQITEGYDDRKRFHIMQQVGMTRSEVRASVRSQVLLVFFLPLAAAGVHILAAFRMITKLLRLFSLTNITLFIQCVLGSLLVFSIIYAIVYILTARVYYQIVRVK